MVLGYANENMELIKRYTLEMQAHYEINVSYILHKSQRKWTLNTGSNFCAFISLKKCTILVILSYSVSQK